MLKIKEFLKPSLPKATALISALSLVVLSTYKDPTPTPVRVKENSTAVKRFSTRPQQPQRVERTKALPKTAAPNSVTNERLKAMPVRKPIRSKSSKRALALVKKKNTKRKKRTVAQALPSYFHFETENTSDAIDYPSPLNEIFEVALNEIPLTSPVQRNETLAAARVTLDTQETVPAPPPVMEVRAVMGTIRKQEFEEHKDAIKLAKAQLPELNPPHLPKPDALSVSKNPKRALVASASVPKLKEPISANVLVGEKNSQPAPELPAPTQLAPSLVAPHSFSLSPTSEEDTKENSLNESVVSEPALEVGLLSKESRPEQKVSSVSTQVPSRPVVSQRRPVDNAKAQRKKEEPAPSIIDGKIFGRLSAGDRVLRWLDEVNGHIELRLHPAKSRDSHDTIHIGALLPDEEFSLENLGLKGEFRLYASLFQKGSSSVRARIPYKELISARNYKKRILFHLSDSSFQKALQPANSPSATVILTAPIFEASFGSHRNPKSIPNAQVRVVGIKKWESIVASREGNVRIEGIPKRSQLILEVSAEGYLTTRKLVSIFDNDVHTPIYLLSQQTLGTVGFHKSSRQDKDKGILLGRVFDPQSRSPLSGEQIKISFRRGNPLYFDPLVKSEMSDLGFGAWSAMFLGAVPSLNRNYTSELGSFGFFNLSTKVSLRSVFREGKPAILTEIPPGQVRLMEFGRSGSKTIAVRRLDPVSGSTLEGELRFVGGNSLDLDVDEKGYAVLPEIDYAGLLTLESTVPDYPRTWHTIAFNPLESKRRLDLFMLEDDVIHASLRDLGVQSLGKNSDRGILVGDVGASLPETEKCASVELLRSNGLSVEQNQGPYALGAQEPVKKFCLNRNQTGFVYVDLKPGRYIEKLTSTTGSLLRVRAVHVGPGTLSMSVH